MDINEKIAQRRRELEAQATIDRRTETEKVQLAVERNLKSPGFQHPRPLSDAMKSTEEVPDVMDIESEQLQKKIAEETDKALDALATERFTTLDKIIVGAMLGLTIAFLINSEWIFTFLSLCGALVYVNRRIKYLREKMKIEQDSFRT